MILHAMAGKLGSSQPLLAGIVPSCSRLCSLQLMEGCLFQQQRPQNLFPKLLELAMQDFVISVMFNIFLWLKEVHMHLMFCFIAVLSLLSINSFLLLPCEICFPSIKPVSLSRKVSLHKCSNSPMLGWTPS